MLLEALNVSVELVFIMALMLSSSLVFLLIGKSSAAELLNIIMEILNTFNMKFCRVATPKLCAQISYSTV